MPRRHGTKADPPEATAESAPWCGAGNDPQQAPTSRREKLIHAIAQEEARLARLEAEQAESRHRLGALQAELASLDAEPEIRVPPPLAGETPVPRTSAEKVKLFRSLFRGREDVFPTRFVSKKTGKPGYAPACRNKFVRGVCELPKVKCGECPNQAFIPVEDAAVVRHLTGRHVMGVYPLLEDETCWFLAVDLDESTWREDVTAFVETCRRFGLPTAVERSRSGNGAHVWFFFSAPVPASTARKMGCYLVTETMSRRHELSMDSYDRLFPSQDTMPRGGFGNLIALPLQYEPRQLGNSVFLDEKLRPYPDDQQWAFLASVRRIDPATVERIAREATREGSVVDVRVADRARLEEMIEEATADCYNESEQIAGWFATIDENLEVPFGTMVLGVVVTIERVELNRSEEIVAVCRRGPERQSLPILDLPLPTPPPAGGGGMNFRVIKIYGNPCGRRPSARCGPTFEVPEMTLFDPGVRF